MNKHLLYGILFSGLSLGLSENVFSQDIFSCDYIRRLKVNHCQREFSEKHVSSEINFSEPLAGELKNSLEGIIMNIHFRTNESDLFHSDSLDLESYCKEILKPYVDKKGINSFNIEGYADCVGSEKDNLILSDKRCLSIANFLKRKFPQVDFYISAFGESQSRETQDSLLLGEDRVGKIIPDENPLKRALDICRADVYLLDQSGSMNQNGEWKLLQKYSFPDSSEVYSFSKLMLPPNSTLEDLNPRNYPEFFHTYDIKTEIARGKTAYYPANNILIPSLENDRTVTAIINGKNNFGNVSSKEIIDKAKSKSIKVNHVGINLSEDSQKDFIDIATQTGGKYYFFRKI